MVDSSGSMVNVILPPQYLVDRPGGGKVYPNMNWFNDSSASNTTALLDANFPASFIASSSTFYCPGTAAQCNTTGGAPKVYTASAAEDWRPTCQIHRPRPARMARPRSAPGCPHPRTPPA